MNLTLAEVTFLMQCINKLCGGSYLMDPAIGKLQAKLSIQAEVLVTLRDTSKPYSIKVPELKH